MKTFMKGAIWQFLDPFLLRLLSRLKHLESMRELTVLGQNFESSACFDSSVVFLPGAKICNDSCRDKLLIGSHSHIAGQLRLITSYGQLGIGNHCFVGAGSRIWAFKQIEIGNCVLISHLVDIHDGDSHPLDAQLRRQHCVDLFGKKRPIDYSGVPASPVLIEDDVWIGFKSTILKGVTIGKGAVIAACSVVTNNVPAHTLVAGNPARVLRCLD
jgi:acetyltransferase-like isoleucine patch superfamily enzyme